MHQRSLTGLVCTAVLIACYSGDLWSLAVRSAATDLNSYILLVPFISAYLLFARRKNLPAARTSAPLFATVFFTAGILLLAVARIQMVSAHAPSHNDSLTLTTLSFVLLLSAIGFLFLGSEWMASAAFPIGFLIFLVPLPDYAINWLETGSKFASADAAHLMFLLSGTPVSRDGTIFQLPGIAFEVAQECSGIHSSLALFITSLVASYVFLKSPWRRALLVTFVIPLGILRNGFRIWVIGQLCVHLGGGMIHSVIHTKGGPLFFALSLVPLVFLLWFLRHGEASQSGTGVPPVIGSNRKDWRDASPTLLE